MSKYRLQLNKRFFFGGLYCLLMALIFVRYVFRIDFPAVILLAVTVVMILAGGRNEILAVLICCIPLTTAFLHTYTLLIGILVFAFKYRRDIRIDLSVIPILLLMVWELLHGYGEDFSPVSFVGNFSAFLLCGLLMWQDSRKVDYPFIVRSFALTVSIMCVTLLGMVLARSGFNLVSMVANMQRLGQNAETTGTVTLEINPNSLGVMCVLAITGLLQMITTGRKTAGDMFMVVLMLVCGTLTTSRTYLVLLVMMALLFWVGQKGSIGRKLLFLLALALTAAVVVGILLVIFPEVVDTFIKRFQVEDITTGRSELFVNYNRFFLSSGRNMFFGVGLNDFAAKIMAYAVLSNVPHNGTQELLLVWGIPGLLIFLLFLLSMLWRGKENAGRHRILHYIPLILLLAKAQAGQMLTSDYTMLAFALAYLSLAFDYSGLQGKKR